MEACKALVFCEVGPSRCQPTGVFVGQKGGVGVESKFGFTEPTEGCRAIAEGEVSEASVESVAGPIAPAPICGVALGVAKLLDGFGVTPMVVIAHAGAEGAGASERPECDPRGCESAGTNRHVPPSVGGAASC
jgi:hypothetical protein